jgi:hypothetical protein
MMLFANDHFAIFFLIVALAAKHNLPAVYFAGHFVSADGGHAANRIGHVSLLELEMELSGLMELTFTSPWKATS